MRIGLVMIFILLCGCLRGAVEARHAEVLDGIARLQTALKNGDCEAVAACIRYPFRRPYPTPCIQDADEFIARYDEVFDSELTDAIVQSMAANDWDEVGWRGFCLGSGRVWLDFDGKVVAVNHQTEAAKRKQDALIEEDRNCLHPDLRGFIRPVLQWEMERHRIRIDEVGEDVYRYASWPIGEAESAEPIMVIGEGERYFDGNGGNHHYTFMNGSYEYRCDVAVITEREDDFGDVSIWKNGECLRQEVVLRTLGR